MLVENIKMESLQKGKKMATFAVIENEKVINIIIAESKTIAQELTGKVCAEYTNEDPAGIGWTYDGTNFISPDITPTEE
jgi:hypothetical protein